MLRGAIEAVTDVTISGWLYSPDVDLRGRVVLAFSGQDCIGSGRVEIFREDLRSAGLGSGYAGFRFALAYLGTPVPESVVIKLEGSDAVILQHGARILPHGPAGDGDAGPAARPPPAWRSWKLAAMFAKSRVNR